jgi:hypothetical protein
MASIIESDYNSTIAYSALGKGVKVLSIQKPIYEDFDWSSIMSKWLSSTVGTNRAMVCLSPDFSGDSKLLQGAQSQELWYTSGISLNKTVCI